MSRRTWAGLLAVALVFVMSVQAARRDVPYVTFSPGPTVNVLGESGDEDIISVSGRTTYRDDGGLRLTTVIPSGPEDKVSIPQLVSAWIDPDRAVYPYRAIYPTEATRDSVREQSSVQMVSSQDNAVAAALGALEIPFSATVKVAEVTEDGPADGKLEVGDVILAANGRKVTTLEQLTGIIRPLPVGSRVTLEVERDGRKTEKTLTTTASPQDGTTSAVLVSIAPGYAFPFEVDLNIDENIGGPSGGLMFALGIYDVLTPGSLTDGKVVAGTGEIDAQGRVGEIGGIQQKLVGAQDDGAELFLVPAGNCADALGGNYDPEKMRLVKVTTLEEAIDDVEAWVKDPDAKLARCTR
jgi:PDZ domain-containing protein